MTVKLASSLSNYFTVSAQTRRARCRSATRNLWPFMTDCYAHTRTTPTYNILWLGVCVCVRRQACSTSIPPYPSRLGGTINTSVFADVATTFYF